MRIPSAFLKGYRASMLKRKMLERPRDHISSVIVKNDASHGGHHSEQEQALQEAEILMAHVKSGKLPKKERDEALARVGDILKKLS